MRSILFLKKMGDEVFEIFFYCKIVSTVQIKLNVSNYVGFIVK